MSFEVRDSVALVTGANRGIGKSIVETLMSNGVRKVYGAVRSIESLGSMVEEFGGDKLIPVELDLTNKTTIENAANIASDVNLLINNAGVLRVASVLKPTASDDLKFELNANVFGLLDIAQAFAPVLKANGGGALVQLNSVVSVKSFPDFSTYCASKAAAYSLTQSLRYALAEQGTLVVSVHPGPIDTDMGDSAGLTDIAEPPSLVADAMLESLREGEFHAFAGTMAKELWQVYSGFAKSVVEADMSE